MKRKGWASAFVLIVVLAALDACNGHDPSDTGQQPRYTSAQITADLNTVPLSKAYFAVSFAGTAADITEMTVDVKNGPTFLAQGAPLMNNNGVWSVTVDDLPIGPQLSFIGHAYNNASAEIFTGTTSQAMTGSNDRVVIVLGPVTGGTMQFPKITQISRPAQIAAGGTASISISVQGGAGERLSYLIEPAGGGGDFAPLSGSMTLNGTTGTFVVGYSAPSTTGTYLHTVTVTNSKDNSVEADFDMTVIQSTAGAEISVHFAPVVTGISAERSGSDVTFTATVSDDGPADELRYQWNISNQMTFASATSNPAVLQNYDESLSGTITLTVTDQNGTGGRSTVYYALNAGQFPDTVVVDSQPTGTASLPPVIASPLSSPQGLAVDENNIYWIENGKQAIKRYSIATGVTSTILAGVSGSTFVVDGTFVYWKETGNCVLRKVPVAGGPVQDVLNSLNNVGDMEVSNGFIYWTESGVGGMVKKVAVSGGVETTLASGLNNPMNLVVDSTSVYWTEQAAGGSVKKVSINGGMVTTLAGGLNLPFDIAVEGTNLYWTEGTTGGTIKKTGTNGGMATVVASMLNSPTFLAADGENVYWTEAGTRSLRKAGATGGLVTTLSSETSFIYGIVLTPTHVIWETSSNAGSIKSLMK